MLYSSSCFCCSVGKAFCAGMGNCVSVNTLGGGSFSPRSSGSKYASSYRIAQQRASGCSFWDWEEEGGDPRRLCFLRLIKRGTGVGGILSLYSTAEAFDRKGPDFSSSNPASCHFEDGKGARWRAYPITIPGGMVTVESDKFKAHR